MSESSVPAADVIKVLQKSPGIFIALIDAKNHIYAIESGDFMEAMVLKGRIGKRFLFRLKEKLNIPIHYFWHPESLDGGPSNPRSLDEGE